MKIDPGAPTGLERQKQAITKARYMQWRDTITTTSRYGYRIEAIKVAIDSWIPKVIKSNLWVEMFCVATRTKAVYQGV